MLYQVTRKAEIMYEAIEANYSILEKIFSRTRYPRTSDAEKRQFAREIMSRIVNKDDESLFIPNTGLAEDEWRSVLHDALAQNPKWQELLERTHEGWGYDFDLERTAMCVMCWVVNCIGQLLPPEYNLTREENHLPALRSRQKIASRINISASELDTNIAYIESRYKWLKNYIQKDTAKFVEQALIMTELAMIPLESGVLTGDMPGLSKPSMTEKVEATIAYSTEQAQKILALLGAMSSQFKVKTAKSKDVSYSWQFGNEIPKLQLDEFLKDDDQFTLEFAEEKLAIRSNSDSPLGNGPVVVLLDESTSMLNNLNEDDDPDDENAHKRYIWSKAFVLLVYKLAMKQNRDVIVLGFGDYTVYQTEVKTANIAEIDRLLNHKPSEDYTGWKRPINDAIEVIKTYSKYKSADILLITDGEDPSVTSDKRFIDKLNKEKKDLRFKIQGVICGSNQYKETLATVADNVVSITSMADTAQLSSFVEEI